MVQKSLENGILAKKSVKGAFSTDFWCKNLSRFLCYVTTYDRHIIKKRKHTQHLSFVTLVYIFIILKHYHLKKLFVMNKPQRDSESILKNLGDLGLVILINCIFIKKWIRGDSFH